MLSLNFAKSIISTVLLCSIVAFAAPAGTPSLDASEATQTAPYAFTDSNKVLWTEVDKVTPEAIRGSLGATILGPNNVPSSLQNPDLLAPPSTDAGTVGNAKWPFSLSHNRLQIGGWARQQNVKVMPIATDMAGVNMRLEAGAVREMHWHKTAEWAYVLKGSVTITAVNPSGGNWLDTVNEGDLWYFPAGVPHVLQATAHNPDGAEFLLVFDNGDFSEDSTFSLTDWLAHTPKSVLAKNFHTTVEAFSHIPGKELYIFPATPLATNESTAHGSATMPYTFKMSAMKGSLLAGGSAKVVDSSVFNVSTTIAAAEVSVEPGAMRGKARTFNYQAGDVAYIPGTYGHYVENTGNTTLQFLEVFKSDKFEDISLNQWLALTPPDIVKAHLQLSDDVMEKLNTTKVTVTGPSNT
ncbi:oxalate decarboxylase [Cytidiella melzeri]|nr:oxalate decarboxylase [Cytidiella melzeri]